MRCTPTRIRAHEADTRDVSEDSEEKLWPPFHIHSPVTLYSDQGQSLPSGPVNPTSPRLTEEQGHACSSVKND